MIPQRQIDILRKACAQDTAYRPEKWDANNPFFDHCVPVSLFLQDQYGGELVIVDAVHKQNASQRIGHVYNIIDGTKIDITEEQFNHQYLFQEQNLQMKGHKTIGDLLLSDPDLQKKYLLFKARMEEHL